MPLNLPITGVDVFLEKRKAPCFVGTLTRTSEHFVFTYDDAYLFARAVIPLGPELPLTDRQFRSPTLFPSFEDRLPSKENPAYPEYCHMMGIRENETDLFVLLSHIARRGPSSFVFWPHYERAVTARSVLEFRQALGFSTRDFARCFEISQASLTNLENGRTTGKDVLKKLELLVRFPEAAIYLLTVNGGWLSQKRYRFAMTELMHRKDPPR